MTHPTHMVTIRDVGELPCDGDERITHVASVAIETPAGVMWLCDRCADSLWASLTFRRDAKREEAA